jgi:spermidine synthase
VTTTEIAAGRSASAGPSFALYLAVACSAGAVIALQIAIMRIFSVGSWAHFGSLVVSLALLGFGLASAIMCIAERWFDTHWRGSAATALVLFGPLTVASNLLAQQFPFNAIFIISDPAQKWRLAANFVLYLLPFLAGAFFLGVVFLKSRTVFGRVYFADLAGAGASGLVLLGSMYVFPPENLIVVPLALWAIACAAWFLRLRSTAGLIVAAVFAVASFAGHLALPPILGIQKLAVSDYKGVAYARKFPDARRVFENHSPFGELELYASSYLHFAPGLSDNAAFNLPEVPENAYLGMYIDGEGPSGVMRALPPEQTAYFRFLPMYYPYVLKHDPKTFVIQFGGGISTTVALRSGSKSVTVAEANPAVLNTFLTDPDLRKFTGDILHDPHVTVVPYEGRLYLANTANRFDVIDLSLADSAGLSNPGGFAIVEKFPYTREAMLDYMHALADGGILSVTLWNKEEPPKSVLKLYTTMVEAARLADPASVAQSFFVTSSYLSTTTVLYKRGGFTADEIATLQKHTAAMSFDEIYYPGIAFDEKQTGPILDGFRNSIFGTGEPTPPAALAPAANGDATAPSPNGDAANPNGDQPSAATAPDPNGDANPNGDQPPPADATTDATTGAPADQSAQVPATTMDQLAWHYLINGGWDDIAARYVFDTRPLTNDRPYFAAYVKTGDLPHVTDRLDLLQDEWGYLTVWATFGIACIAAFILVLLPVIFGWRAIFRYSPGKFRTIVYFGCLGLGYIAVEVGLIAKFVQALANPTVSASILITGMLVFSGLGSALSERVLPRIRVVMPVIFVLIAALLIGYGLFLDRVLDYIGTLAYAPRLALAFLLIAPPAFLMGFPMPTAMTTLGRLGKDHMFVWAWGINGCFSVIGAAAVPIVATAWGLSAVLDMSGAAYLIAAVALTGVVLPLTRPAVV